MDDLIPDFISETQESLSQLDEDMVRLETMPNDPELLGAIFRVFHTVKGTCGFLNLSRLETLAHDAENVLSKFRDGELEVTPARITTILNALDRIRSILDDLEATGVEPSGDDSDMLDELAAILSLKDGDEEETKTNETESVAPEASPEAFSETLDPSNSVPSKATSVTVTSLEDLLKQPVGTLGLEDLDLDAMFEGREPTDEEMQAVFDAVEGYEPKAPAETDDNSETEATEAPTESQKNDITPPDTTSPPALKADQASSAEKKPNTDPQPANTATGPVVVQETMRVKLGVIESLMTLTSELVLSRNQMLRLFDEDNDAKVTSALQRLNQVTGEIQEAVMKTRMQPIRNAWAKMPRLVRELSSDLDKPIRIVMQGEDTEVDRQVLELIRDPLVHLVRNSADHGLETREDRATTGKPEQGCIELSAHHEGGYLVVEVKDDGRGISRDKIVASLIKKGLATQSQLDALTDQQVLQQILKPGFSTAESVTSVSGRGVGMDVVNTNMQQIGGVVEISSKFGFGTKVRMKIPLTLAVISALIVRCAGAVFAMPQISLVELVRLQENDPAVRKFGERVVLSLRDELLPVIRLEDIMGIKRSDPRPESEFVLVLQLGAIRFGICVDAVLDTEEIVVKPASGLLESLPVYAGNTILGDGRVAMILDPTGLAELSGASDQAIGKTAGSETPEAEESRQEHIDMVLFQGFTKDSITQATPVGTLNRLESIEIDKIFLSGGRTVMRYNDSLLQVLTLTGEDLPQSGRYPALVFSDNDKTFALLVKDIEDVVRMSTHIELESSQAGIVGSVLIDGRPIEILDTLYYFNSLFQGEGSSGAASNLPQSSTSSAGPHDMTKILVVDDSPFYLQMISGVIKAKGYEPVCVDSAEAALNVLSKGDGFEAVMTDLDMPKMNGLEFCTALRALDVGRDLPIFVVTNSVDKSLHAAAAQVGANGVFMKFDHLPLLSAVEHNLRLAA